MSPGKAAFSIGRDPKSSGSSSRGRRASSQGICPKSRAKVHARSNILEEVRDGADSWWYLVEKLVQPSYLGGSLWRLVSIVCRANAIALSVLNIGDAYLLYQSYKRRYLTKPQTLYLGYQSSMC